MSFSVGFGRFSSVFQAFDLTEKARKCLPIHLLIVELHSTHRRRTFFRAPSQPAPAGSSLAFRSNPKPSNPS